MPADMSTSVVWAIRELVYSLKDISAEISALNKELPCFLITHSSLGACWEAAKVEMAAMQALHEREERRWARMLLEASGMSPADVDLFRRMKSTNLNIATNLGQFMSLQVGEGKKLLEQREREFGEAMKRLEQRERDNKLLAKEMKKILKENIKIDRLCREKAEQVNFLEEQLRSVWGICSDDAKSDSFVGVIDAFITNRREARKLLVESLLKSEVVQRFQRQKPVREILKDAGIICGEILRMLDESTLAKENSALKRLVYVEARRACQLQSRVGFLEGQRNAAERYFRHRDTNDETAGHHLTTLDAQVDILELTLLQVDMGKEKW